MKYRKIWELESEEYCAFAWASFGSFIGWLLLLVGGMFVVNYCLSVPTVYPRIAVSIGILHLLCGALITWRAHRGQRWLTAHGIVFFFPAHQPAYWDQDQEKEDK
ncbi:hypothetical protein A3H10_04865 [Candidatus Uhrbacteria bacterium RIFCSPLOWO2_12_FULL_46_10]|uniref:Uncharacterized protein n=1 Tax=Candidatus Uhrbacteria bacterium RIFCSPLOWO2_01_FULL_47_25 TaxID=1802402 RepID=A0A1F7UTV3_9BACT|nr:MAG: hypothetical protein UX68_C0010G0009 [Parcubacteria group bacterium GW2011_GWA2_46_9]OGL59321.1 MAG: hypothetical protein A2752_01475 [Candidatus Uhrbacteria bacterium RIFCSPHIGHO2_01_FULL_46_23]OGL68435.1 MAG: hypothetical protein A3D60_02345 [Candidatus Uhrbacteria bacterium RIFCSPHIGHO2_02_FULL_47_29]OGL75637.1 MAG: hypothetical protein A3E96_01190 [Candidatus Uhrbacteria bacterium RIFCSPHIGHO2_12_FULL_46_13]OGL81154.1 MAG: hypothetical protein A2936_00960 [Candidatus Uhrbacteria bac